MHNDTGITHKGFVTLIRYFLIAIFGATMFVSASPALAAPATQFDVAVTITIPPPDLPVYDQPPCPSDNYIWTPGYWAWDPDQDDYYWVPGTWVLAPDPGLLWTPGYWSWSGASFLWVDGYWGPVVGFYGGVNYGFGYFGDGYVGGRWDHDHFFYNRAVNNVNVTNVHNVYNTTVVNNVTVNRVSYNGGRGGITARPTPQEEATSHERHVAPIAAQRQQMQDARSNRQLWASVNHGRPPIAATPKPADFKGNNVQPAREGGAVHTSNGAASGNRSNPANGNPGTPEGRMNNRPNEPNRATPPSNRMTPTPNGNTVKQQQKAEQNQAKENQKAQEKQSQENFRSQQQEQQRREQPNQQTMRNRPQEEQRMQPPQRQQAPERQAQAPREQNVQPRQEQRQAPQHEARPPQQKSAPAERAPAEKKSEER